MKIRFSSFFKVFYLKEEEKIETKGLLIQKIADTLEKISEIKSIIYKVL